MQQISTEEHSRRLALIARGFTDGLEPIEVMDIVLRQGMVGLQSTGGVLALVDGGLLRPICIAGTAHDALRAFGPLSLDLEVPLTKSARENVAVWVSSRDDAKVRFPFLAESSATVSQAWATIPLVAHGAPFGVLGLSFMTPFEFAEADRLFLTTLAGITGLALSSWARLDRQRQHDHPSSPHERTVVSRPAHATGSLSDLTDSMASAVLEKAPDGIVIIDDNGRVLAANQQVETMFGFERSSLLGRPVEVLLPDRYRSVHVYHRASYAAAAVVRPMGRDVDLWAQRADGSKFPVDISLSSVEDNGQTAIVAAIRDITDRFEAEQRVQETETLFRTVFESAPVGIVITRQDFGGHEIFDRVNFVFCTMVGLRTEDLLGRRIADVILAGPAADSHQLGGEPTVGSFSERRFVRADGTHGRALIHAGEMEMAGEDLTLLYVVNVSERGSDNFNVPEDDGHR